MGPDAAQALDPLIEALKDEDAQVRAEAAFALSGLGTQAKKALPALTEALKDKNEVVRKSAQDAIDSIQTASEANRLAGYSPGPFRRTVPSR